MSLFWNILDATVIYVFEIHNCEDFVVLMSGCECKLNGFRSRLNKVLVNRRRLCICNIFHHWLRTSSTIYKKTRPSCPNSYAMCCELLAYFIECNWIVSETRILAYSKDSQLNLFICICQSTFIAKRICLLMASIRTILKIPRFMEGPRFFLH